MIRLPKTFRLLLPVLLVAWMGCTGTRPEGVPDGALLPATNVVDVTLLQLNDVYEITPIAGGTQGGLARVATLRERLLAENPHTYTLLAGDFYSPSALGTARVDGERLAGKQMVAVLNRMGLDYVTFGNHEFDVSREQFYDRLEESRFTYVSANVFDESGRPFPGVVPHVVLEVPAPNGRFLRLGLIGVTVGSNPKDYVTYTDPLEATRTEVERIRDDVDVIVALTHLDLQADMDLAAAVPEIDLILGGHEHENWLVRRGADLTPIAKADANAKTVFIHRLRYDVLTETLLIDSDLYPVTDALADDEATAAEADRWVEIAFEGFRQSGLKPAAPIVTITEPLDGLESSVRNHPTALTDLIAESMMEAAGEADLAVYNSGSIRIDDVLQPGTLIEYDVIRVLPFGGEILTVELPGSLLDSTLTQGEANRGTGGFLQTAGVARGSGGWLIDGRPLRPDQVYRMAVNDFLVSGRETGLEYLTLEDSRVRRLGTHGDVRLAVIATLKRRYGGN